MTRLFNDPAAFASQMAEGFVLANAHRLAAVPGGVVRSTQSVEPKVAVVVGGGSGHYPAFAGLVGPGLADGAVMGGVFASPSVNQVVSVARAADQGRGVLLAYGNYTGDVLHFEEARQRLVAEGIECRSVAVTDDVYSAPVERRLERRGIAGDLAVFKVAGAAAEAGLELAEVERLARLANDRTRSIGVAFSGCTLPGADEPLFTVEPGMMAVGLGIHGEPGIDLVPVPTADGLAELFVEALVAEVPDGVTLAGARVVPLLNGLGSVKYEELYVVYRRVHELLTERGLTVVDPQVGEFCTSLDMAGASLTLCWLDERLEELWLDPVDAVAFRRAGAAFVVRERSLPVAAPDSAPVLPPASPVSREQAAAAARALLAVRDVIDASCEELGRIDAVAGDGDHGIGMQRGATACAATVEGLVAAGAGLGSLLTRAGEAWSDGGGGTSGALWGAMLGAAGTVLGDEEAATGDRVVAAVAAGLDAVTGFGGAAVGDKTMVDAMVPFARTLAERLEPDGLAAAWRTAAGRASEAAHATADLLPRKGRARTHGESALGTPDAGAISFALVVERLADHVGT